MQNAIGIGMASLLGLMGLLAGSITLWWPRAGVEQAVHRALWRKRNGNGLRPLAWCGGLIGGPVARYLVKPPPEGRPRQMVPASRTLSQHSLVMSLPSASPWAKSLRNGWRERLSNCQPLSACCLSG
ncbi:MAG: hypothetical protein ACLR9W_15410 [Enterobacter hormaechei]